MRVLGLSAFQHDSAAVLVEDGRIVAAAQEERFTRKKHDAGFPTNAVAYCLTQAGCRMDDVDCVTTAGTGAWADRVLRVDATLAHAASAFFPSPFADAAVLVMDATTAWGMGSGTGLRLDWQHPHSLGALYSAVTRYIGFRANSGEYKVMGLAPYGQPKYAPVLLDSVIRVAPDGGFTLDLPDFAALFGQPVRQPDSALDPFHMDMAASVQAVTEHAILTLARTIRAETGARNLCLGGGVALNCVANGKLLRAGIFDNIWVQPAAGEAGGALGAALAVTHLHHGQPRQTGDAMNGCYLGPTHEDVEARLTAVGAKFAVLADDHLMEATAQALAEQKAVGWVQGRMEFGPRALGNRSILGDPRSPTMQKVLNLKVKYRESFRPFAPSVLAEDAAECFQLDCPSPYMLLVAPTRGPHWPAITHVDYSARVQTVQAEANPRFHSLISAFKAKTGCPMLVNTSFNVRGEPMVNTPEDAFRCFMGSEIEVLVVGNCFLTKEDQDSALALDYAHAFELD
ncbi:MAG: hypothetical protein H7Y60_01690 [Rhodospirillaceae bacterium]|nr:hypothetical protein [Rhodospirillales bacterium]